MGAVENNVLPSLLLMTLAFVLAISIFFIYLVLRLSQRETLPAPTAPCADPLPHPSPAQKHLAFKPPNCWLAIKNQNVHAVQAALALQDVRPCSWIDGFAGDIDQKLFIAPPVSRWVFVIGAALPNPADDEDACFHFLMELSRKLGHVQFFSASSVLNQHAWARVDSGRVLRAYAWAGRTLWNQGELTWAERALEMNCRPYAHPDEGLAFDNREAAFDNADKIHLLAARWSLDPDEIDEHFTSRAFGLVGEPTRHF